MLAKWEKLKMNIFAFLNQSDVEECANLGFDNDITAVLVLLRSLSMKKTFALNVDKMIVYFFLFYYLNCSVHFLESQYESRGSYSKELYVSISHRCWCEKG